jgi:hypothetical protein
LKCEIYGKLILAVLVHRIHAHLNNLFWNRAHRELSFDKFYKRFQERAFAVRAQLLVSVQKAAQYLAAEIRNVVTNCLKLKQHSRQSTLEMLARNMGEKVDTLPTDFLT